ncbi:MAG: hypothetical protein R3B07_26550 [Polyangiaceae bacterium]
MRSATSASASAPASKATPPKPYFGDDREGVVVRDWLSSRRIAAADIAGDTVPTAWLCPRTTEPSEAPTCFEAQLGAPAHDGLVCRYIPRDSPWQRDSIVTAWRTDGGTLRQVLRVHTLCHAQVNVSNAEDLLIDVDCDRAKIALEWEQKVAIGVSDKAWSEHRGTMSNRVGAYHWDGGRFVFQQ